MKVIMPNLVILDIMMPNKTGFEVLQELNNDPDITIKNIPIIVSSNLGNQSDIDMAKSLGAIDYLVKSRSTPHDLIEKVRQYLPVGE